MTTVRRCTAALAVTAVLCAAFAPAAHAGGDVRPPAPSSSPSSPSSAAPSSPAPSSSPSPSVKLPHGLYGDKDPTYDGVWRQSLALLGQAVAGVRPSDDAVRWLKRQRCADGGFAAFRADPAAPCGAGTLTDSNSTAAAVQALSSLGDQRPFMAASVEWLRTTQNKDGGWGYTPGTPSDANSTSLVIGALTSAGVRPTSMRVPRDSRATEGKDAYDALVALSIPCDAGSGADAGAFAYQPDQDGRLTANDDATAAAVLAGLGKRLVSAPVTAGPAPTCAPAAASERPSPERAARNGAAYLASALAATGHLDQPPLPGTESGDGGAAQPDVGNTADAVVALTAAGYGDQATGALEWLKKNSGPWAQQQGPAAYAQLIFAAYATDTDPRNFGGIDLVERLNATGPTPKSVAPPEPRPGNAAESAIADGGAVVLLWVIGIGVVAALGTGFLVSRRKTRQP
ncbi:prenyltransferase/squalene oxidase repeat-containing protein [Streptomyces sp. NPDC127033]|uniref:prenyltransferase/squalene oxidase repeat-containing protein n=1 Tax=Streptomyces sp. NPDC127033 TaxID=3347110 RepID=UPI0036625985